MNQFTIEFKNPKDLADKISKYNDLMNPKPISELAVPVTDFNGEPIAEDPTELDVEPADFDPAAYWVDFKSWLKSIGNEGIKKALEVFRSHGVEGNPSSDDLTPEIVAELDALMKGE